MAYGNPQLSAEAYPSILQLARRSGRWLQLLHCLRLMETSLWWCAAILVAGTIIHHSVAGLSLPAIIVLAGAPLMFAIIIGLVSGRLSLTETASRCDRWLNSKQLYTTAVEYLTAGSNKQNRLANSFVLMQAEQLSRQWLPRVRQIQCWKPSAWLVLPVGISIAALFFQTLPGKQGNKLNGYHTETQLSQQITTTATKEGLASRLDAAFKQINQQQLLAGITAEPDSSQQNDDAASGNLKSDQTAGILASAQTEATVHSPGTTTDSTSGQDSASAGNSTQTGASNAEAIATKQSSQLLTDPDLEISYYGLETGTLSGRGETASGRTQDLPASALAVMNKRAASPPNLELDNMPQYDAQTSPRQRRYLNDYFTKLKAEQ